MAFYISQFAICLQHPLPSLSCSYSCSECVALQDPYCAWDKIAGKCRSHGAPRWLEENYFYQNVATGQHAACPSGELNGQYAAAQIKVNDSTDYHSPPPRSLPVCVPVSQHVGKINSKDANVGEQKGFRNDMDLLDSRRQSKDQEIIDNIDKNFEGKLQVKIKSRLFSLSFLHLLYAFACLFLYSTSVAYFPHQFRCQVYHIYQFCCHFSNHIFISLVAAAACLPSSTFHLPLATFHLSSCIFIALSFSRSLACCPSPVCILLLYAIQFQSTFSQHFTLSALLSCSMSLKYTNIFTFKYSFYFFLFKFKCTIRMYITNSFYSLHRQNNYLYSQLHL